MQKLSPVFATVMSSPSRKSFSAREGHNILEGLRLSQTFQEAYNNSVLGILILIIIVQVLGSYVTIQISTWTLEKGWRLL